MQIPILIEPVDVGRYRARAGEPFALTAEGASQEEARSLLERPLSDRLRNGAQLTSVNVPAGESAQNPVRAENAYLTDPSFREMQEIIAENRRLEDEAYRRLEESTGS
jgi:hypothetical protein